MRVAATAVTIRPAHSCLFPRHLGKKRTVASEDELRAVLLGWLGQRAVD